MRCHICDTDLQVRECNHYHMSKPNKPKPCKNKSDILALLDSIDNPEVKEAYWQLEYWTSFNKERFTPQRFAERLRRRSERLATLGMGLSAQFFNELANRIHKEEGDTK